MATENDILRWQDAGGLAPGSRTLAEIVEIVRQLIQNPDIDNARRGTLRAAAKDHSHFPQATADLVRESFWGGTTTSGSVGELGWTTAGMVSQIDGEAGHPGILRISGVNAAAGLSGTGGQPILPSDMWDITWAVRVGSTGSFAYRVGLSSSPTASGPVDGIYFEKLTTDTDWFGVTRAASSQTRTAAIAPVTTNWVRLRLRRVDAGTVGFSVNGGTEVTATLTIPTTALTPWAAAITGGAGHLDLDDMEALVTGLAR